MHAVSPEKHDLMTRRLLTDHWIAALICRTEQRQHVMHEALLSLNWNFPFPTIALLEPVARQKEETFRRRTMERIRTLLEQNLMDSAAVFLTNEGRIGLLFSWQYKGLIERAKHLVTSQLSVETTVGVGKPFRRLSDLYHSYHQAEDALREKFYAGCGGIIHYSLINDSHSSCEYPSNKEKELFDCIKRSPDRKELALQADRLYEFLMRNGQLDIKLVYEITIRLMIGLEKRAAAELENESFSINYEVTSVMQMETLKEVKSALTEYMIAINEQLLKNGKERYRSIIKKTIQFMEQECHSASLHSVAQRVYMTPTYLSLLFKMNTGKTFIEQLTDIRIDKAKHILKNTHLKNYEIAEKVGYQDPRYFSQIFKKKVGLSPSEYRETAGI